MRFDPRIHHRRSIRFPGYDYSEPGAYFVTIVTQRRRRLFGEIPQDEMLLNAAGKMVATTWHSLAERFSNVQIDAVVVMPNHVHGVLMLTQPETGPGLANAPLREGARRGPSLGDVVGAFKSLTTNAYSAGVERHGWRPFRGHLWQRNYFEHIIRNEAELNSIREYISLNPALWRQDPENPTST